MIIDRYLKARPLPARSLQATFDWRERTHVTEVRTLVSTPIPALASRSFSSYIQTVFSEQEQLN